MSSVNKAILVGRLGRDPEIKECRKTHPLPTTQLNRQTSRERTLMEHINTVRIIYDHLTETDTGIKIDPLDIAALDTPNPASHHYRIACFSTPSPPPNTWAINTNHLTISFQEGPIPEVGRNGITMEALLAIIIDRLKGFQSGALACKENAFALACAEQCLHCLKSRTRDRVKRGIEGSYTP